MAKPLKFLLSGPGLIGKKHAALIAGEPGACLEAVVAPDDPDGDNRTFAVAHGARFFSELEEALAHSHFDGAIISSPNAFHFPQAAACIERSVPVLVEKPLTDDIDDARRLVRLAAAASVPVLVGHHRTYNPLLQAVQAFLGTPEFGKPVALQGSALFYKPTHYFEEGPWRTKVGGGPILINLIHEIGLMRSFFGEIDSVFALASHAIRGFEVEDTVAITLTFENGAIGSFLLSDTAASSKSWEMTSGENPAYPFFPEENCYHFAGTNGSLDFPSMLTRYYSREGQASWWAPFVVEKRASRRADPLEMQFAHFIDVIRHGVAPRVSVRDGYLNLLVVQAITRSIESGSVVAVDHDESN